jgi:hypothetical protein
MLRLTVIDSQGGSELITTDMYFRITGGAVWTRPGFDAFPPIRFSENAWIHDGTRFAGIRIEGKCRLVFGISMDPVAGSEVLESISLSGATLCGSGVPFAIYDPDRDVWRGADKDLWWHSLRVESAGLRHESELTATVQECRSL